MLSNKQLVTKVYVQKAVKKKAKLTNIISNIFLLYDKLVKFKNSFNPMPISLPIKNAIVQILNAL